MLVVQTHGLIDGLGPLSGRHITPKEETRREGEKVAIATMTAAISEGGVRMILRFGPETDDESDMTTRLHDSLGRDWVMVNVTEALAAKFRATYACSFGMGKAHHRPASCRILYNEQDPSSTCVLVYGTNASVSALAYSGIEAESGVGDRESIWMEYWSRFAGAELVARALREDRCRSTLKASRVYAMYTAGPVAVVKHLTGGSRGGRRPSGSPRQLFSSLSLCFPR